MRATHEMLTGLLLTLGALWILGALFVAGLCRTASRRRPSDVVIPVVARQNPSKKQTP